MLAQADARLLEKRQSSLEILRGSFLKAYRDQVTLPDGSVTAREYIVHPGAVMVIPLLFGALDNPQLVLERQFRYPVGQVMIEFPAGKSDPHETSLACAQRELREETGYTARQWARAGVLHPAIAYSTESIDIWFARDLELGPRQLDDGEFLDVFLANSDEFLSWCAQGKVTDAKTLGGALWLQNVLAGTWNLDWETPAAQI